MRVLHVVKVKGIGGCERHLLELLPLLSASRVRSEVCVLAAPGLGARDFPSRLVEAGIPVRVMAAGPDLNPRLVMRLASAIRRAAPHLVHTHLIHADVHGQLAARLAGIRGLSSVHDTHVLRTRRHRSAMRFAQSLAEMTIAISDHVRAELVSGSVARQERIRVVPYGVDPSSWARPASEARRARAALGFRKGDFVAGVASRLVPGKGHEVLIEAVRRAMPRVPRLKLAIAGEGSLRGWLEERAARHLDRHSVRFLGAVDDVAAFMSACDVVAVPTSAALAEGFGLAALEAMAAGRPVVASRVGALPEVVEDRVTGKLVAPDDPEHLAAALQDLGGDPLRARRMGRAGCRRAQDRFRSEAMVDGILSVYREIVSAAALTPELRSGTSSTGATERGGDSAVEPTEP